MVRNERTLFLPPQVKSFLSRHNIPVGKPNEADLVALVAQGVHSFAGKGNCPNLGHGTKSHRPDLNEPERCRDGFLRKFWISMSSL